MLLEIHSHTNRHSKCSLIDPVTLVKKTAAKGLQGLVITEHHYLWADEELARLKIDAGAERSFVILAGQEVDTDFGHVLVYGADKTIEEKTALRALRRRYPKAALVLAHPYRKGSAVKKETLLSPYLDGVDIFFSLNHTPKENYAGLKSWHELKFTALSGSDTHSEANAGSLPTQFDHSIGTIEELALEIKNGRVRPFFKEIPKSGSDLTVTEITLGPKGDDELRQRIIIKGITAKRKWDRTKQSAKLLQKIHNAGFSGGPYRVPRVIEINDNDQTLIEEGQRGKNLFDILCGVSPATGIMYFDMAAKWLAEFHKLRLKSGSLAGFFEKEEKKLAAYERSFTNTSNSRLKQAKLLMEFVKEREAAFSPAERRSFILNHGDYHPKNIMIGQDRMHDPGTLFISVIDFANAFEAPPAFDAGYFLSQFKSQFAGHTELLKVYTDERFLKTYIESYGQAAGAFPGQIELFKIRANLSIANYFIKIGKGESAELHSLISKSTALMKQL